MFGSKRRAEKEAATKAAALADLRDTVSNLIGIAEGGAGLSLDWPLILKPGERLVYGMKDAGLFEPRREPGHWSGRSAGFSVPVGDGIRLRIGKSAGTYVQGDETPTIIDRGVGSFTTQRVVFQGSKHTREWMFSKLIGVMHYADQPWTAIQVSNRERTSGLVYTGLPPDSVRLSLAVAIAIFTGEGQEAGRELRDELARLEEAPPPAAPSPVAPAPAPKVESTLPPAMWAADPTGRHQWRYWNGTKWTDQVSDGGRQTVDPMAARPS